MTIKDHIAYLQTLDPNLECWCTWDESCHCWPCKENEGKVVFVGEEDILGNGRVRFYMHEGDHVKVGDRQVFMINY